MKVRNIIIFFFTLLIGLLTAARIEFNSPIKSVGEQVIVPAVSNSESDAGELNDEIDNWQDEDTTNLEIRLIETGEGFHGDQVQARSGETWLGLFKENNRTFLQKTKTRVRLVNDPIVDGAASIRTGKSVDVQPTGNVIFLLKDAPILREGEVESLFDGREENDYGLSLRNDFAKVFDFRGEQYTLRVENRTSHNEFLGVGSKLILENRAEKQTLIYLKEGCDDCGWSLIWVGDLDRDGGLDFYFDLSRHYNTSDKKLFLSSGAKPGKLVKLVAKFQTSGC